MKFTQQKYVALEYKWGILGSEVCEIRLQHCESSSNLFRSYQIN